MVTKASTDASIWRCTANAKVSLDIATLFEEGVIDARTLLEAQELGITTVEVPAGEYGASFAADGVSSFLGLSDGAAVGLGSWLGRGARYGAQGAAVAGVGLASFALGSVGYCGVTCAGGP
jgi:hypothetical protein